MIDNAIEKGACARTRFETSWLIVKDHVGAEGGPPEVLTLGVDGDERILPVFSFEEEALLFLRLSGFKDEWRTSKSGAAGLASVLSGRPARRPRPDPRDRLLRTARPRKRFTGGVRRATRRGEMMLRRITATPAYWTDPKPNGKR